jgi:hypothetical protein
VWARPHHAAAATAASSGGGGGGRTYFDVLMDMAHSLPDQVWTVIIVVVIATALIMWQLSFKDCKCRCGLECVCKCHCGDNCPCSKKNRMSRGKFEI